MNSVEAPWRRNFNFAHEVFHLLTWTSIPPERMIEDPAFRDRIESLANAFASSLLLPGDAVSIAIERHLKDGKIYRADLVENAREFDVSTVALLYRLLNLGYFDREAVERLLNDPTFRQLDRSTMAVSWWEPPPIPERFVRLVFWAYQDGNISRAKLAEYLNVSLLDLTDTLLEYGLDDRENYKAEMLTSRR
ncbi:ImmA/IrrE family metallo-endopeptidase [Dehalococcoidia bacterium]|nr:ImmA/IrrE family metallo-endopeptidase [Dehalococcoidia bacterium]MCL0082030.1 ImmA/IrrE family metallo-endopeptidase [Dehalococcoidia bacterium]